MAKKTNKKRTFKGVKKKTQAMIKIKKKPQVKAVQIVQEATVSTPETKQPQAILEPIEVSSVSSTDKAELAKDLFTDSAGQNKVSQTESSQATTVVSADISQNNPSVVSEPISTPPSNVTEMPKENTEETVLEQPLEDDEKPKSRKKLFLIIILTLLVVMITAGLYVYISTKSKSSSLKKTTQEKILPTSSPTEKPIDLSVYKIDVLNGSEVPGEAKKVGDGLKTKGFNIRSVGNADKSTYQESVIQIKKDVSQKFVDELKKALLAFGSASQSAEFLSASSAADAVVILGTKP